MINLAQQNSMASKLEKSSVNLDNIISELERGKRIASADSISQAVNAMCSFVDDLISMIGETKSGLSSLASKIRIEAQDIYNQEIDEIKAKAAQSTQNKNKGSNYDKY